MAGREGVRSSARLSGAVASTSTAVPVSSSLGDAEREAAAALRRERAARAVERAREVEDSPRVLREKCRQLAKALQEAKHLVVYTGAGISTAADIPDYRGPRGVWTRLQRGESIGRVEVSRARPTFTHMALTALWRRGALKFVVSQNCDGLHLRAGLPRRSLAELHGDMFAERCANCRRVYLRAFDTTERTARHVHHTRRLCHECGRELRDTIVHFGERGRATWPLNWAGALRHAAAADVVLCLGSSLKVLRRYPRLWRMQRAPHARPALYIVNLQWTPKDSVAALKINARCDEVMEQVARRLRLRVPRYDEQADPLLAHAEPLAAPEAHTTRRPTLDTPLADHARVPLPADYYSLSSPSDLSASSDDEVPLCRLAEKTRPRPCPPLLRSFRVSMCTGDATILLRAEHAPAETPPPPPEPPPPPLASPTAALRRFRIARPTPNGTGPYINGARIEIKNHTRNISEPRFNSQLHPCERKVIKDDVLHDSRPRLGNLNTDEQIEIIRNCSDMNGTRTSSDLTENKLEIKHEHLAINGIHLDNSTLNLTPDKDIDETKLPIPPDKPNIIKDPAWDIGTKLRKLLEYEPKIEPNPSVEDNELRPQMQLKHEEEPEKAIREASATLAAAIIRRAVLVCRAHLYPGLHTIITPVPVPTIAAPAITPPQKKAEEWKTECDWCARRYSSRRCLWYGPPRLTPPERRAWRREHNRRFLCACCGEEGAGHGGGDGGWYGKGYRKGRRKQR